MALTRPGENCWRIERAERAALIVDAADYFHLARQAMLRAKRQILLIGWDFDTRICLDYDAKDDAPAELGAFLSWLPRHRPTNPPLSSQRLANGPCSCTPAVSTS